MREKETLFGKDYLAIFFLSIIFCKNLGVIVLIGFIVVLILPGGPFILKLIPNNPSPISFGITISPITGILEIIVFIVFAGIVYQIITQCYSLIFVLPDYILRWVGGPTQPGAMSPAQMASQVQGQLMGAANKVGGLASQGAKDYLTHKKTGADERRS